MALFTLMDQLNHAAENAEYICVFLNFSKAFDKVNHTFRLDRLYHYGIRSCARGWLKSYLIDITKFVTYKGTVSDNQVIRCGVPQGSILGSMLFLVYVKDLPCACSYTLPLLFADGMNLFFEWRRSHMY